MAGLCGGEAHHHGGWNEDCAVEAGPVSPVDGEKGADVENQRGGAVRVHGGDPYLGWFQTRSGGSWDNPTGDQVCVLVT